MPLQPVFDVEPKSIQDQAAGPSGPSETVSGNGGITKDSAFTFDVTGSPFDQEPSGILEEIFQEAASSKDYAHARRGALGVIKQYRLHEQQEHIFGLLDKFETRNSADGTDAADNGRGRDEYE